MLTYEKCSVCGVETGNSLVCERCHEIGELKAIENAEFDSQWNEEETDGF